MSALLLLQDLCQVLTLRVPSERRLLNIARVGPSAQSWNFPLMRIRARTEYPVFSTIPTIHIRRENRSIEVEIAT